ncbi:hypothetical protein N7478_003408 [Penicillium angulare]|uniref:uncharacterized protein n=1 Tax=Penicillium angulare TaxID=116970 RepID=UPI00253FE85E|nr:uncharacterized protein N7478_003408 [Penicillium angulare]KAJ5287722.1 hypothetical protein N7478_003408 [Penicillium angulare]
MSDLSGSRSPVPPPPPPPPKYSRAAHALARFAPFFSGSRPPSPQNNRVDGPRPIRSKSLPGEPQTVTHRTGIPIAALDISPERTHAVIAGKEILKTIRVSPDHSSEEFNIRNAVVSYASTQNDANVSIPHKDQLNVKDVKWSHGNYDRIIATAVANGRIVVYDLQRPGLQLCRFQGHNRQVHRLAFNPHLASWLLSGSQDGSIRMWDLRTASANRSLSTCGSKHVYQGNSDAIRDVRWSPTDGVVFATASDSGAIQMWDSRKTTAPLMRIAAHDRPCFAVDWHPDGKHIVSGGTDRQVKVWDFSSVERRQKPAFQFRTPQPVTNVRWRPPSWVGDSPGSGEWQSSQIVTSYDKEDPRIHLWDLRRSHVPFREFDRYDTPASDLLWHSKDLLWTVGESGVFTQTDVRYAPTLVTRRPTCSVAWSPQGAFAAFGHQRPRRRPRGVDVSEFLHLEDDTASTGEKSLSQSPADDILDEVSLSSSFRSRQTQPTALRPSKSLGSTPPAAVDFIPIVPLNEALAKISTPGPEQLGTIGSIPGATNDESLFRFLARHYSPLMNTYDDRKSRVDALNSLMDSLDHNAECADDVSQAKLAQTWRIVKFAIIQELQRRSRKQSASNKSGVKGKSSKDGLLADRSRPTDDNRQGKVKNRLLKGVMDAEGQRSLNPDAESTSNMTTPLAQPLPDSPHMDDSWSSDSQIPSISDNAIDLDPLPPSVLSSHNGWSMPDREDRLIAPLPLLQAQSASSGDTHNSAGIMADRLRDPLYDPDSDQRSAPRAITGRSDWRVRNHPDYPRRGSEEDFDQKMEHKRAALRDYKQFPKTVLTLDTPMDSNRPPRPDGYNRHDSSESFPMFSASTDSSHPSKSLGVSYSSNGRFPERRSSDGGQSNSYGGRSSTSARRESNLDPSPEELEEDYELDESMIEANRVHLERPSSPPALLTESTPLEYPISVDQFQTLHPLAANVSAYPSIAGVFEDLSQIQIPLAPDTAESKPWSIEAILKEAVRYYHSNSSSVDIQTAAHLLQKLHVLFEDCEEILPYEESEMIFKTYNEYLIRHSMDLEAAELRLSCVPTYPAVYDYAQIDTFMNVFCYTCQKPFENPKRDNTRCHRCSTPQAPCSICMSIDPPAEWVSAQQEQQSAPSGSASPNPESETTSHSSVPTELVPSAELDRFGSFPAPRPMGSALWTWCQGCGHGGHVACMTTWLSDISISEGGCATPGCSHDCGPGPRRDSNRQADSKRRDSVSRSSGAGLVKRDPWMKTESNAVEKVRGMLGAAGVVATTGGTVSNTSSGTGQPTSGAVSPKRVRLVTPGEQGRRKGPSSRSSFAPTD